MVDFAALVAERKKTAIPSRLKAGAAVLGRLWRDGSRCLGSWAQICACVAPSDFCQAKRRWVALVEELHDGPPSGLSGTEPFYVVEAMTVSQFKVSGLTALVELPNAARPVKVGASGTDWGTIADLASLQDDDAALAIGIDAVLKLQGAFK